VREQATMNTMIRHEQNENNITKRQISMSITTRIRKFFSRAHT